MRAGGECLGFLLCGVVGTDTERAGAIRMGIVPELRDVFLEGFLRRRERARGWVIGVSIRAGLAEADGDGVSVAEGCDGLVVGHGI